MGNLNARDPDYWNVVDDPGVRNSEWMANLSDTQSVTDLSIPGTHNTMALEGGPLAWCQSLSLLIQMLIGIRFLDIRVRHYQDTLPIHHGIFFQSTTFNEVLRGVTSYLDAYPSEFIFMRVKEEYKAEQNTKSLSDLIESAINRYGRDRFWLKTSLPTVGESRGKIIILNNFFRYKSDLGIHWDFADVEDTWDTSRRKKWKLFKSHLDQAQLNQNSKLYITFSSHSRGIPRRLARKTNPELHRYVNRATGKLGIIASDYPGPQLITDIINNNKFKQDM